MKCKTLYLSGYIRQEIIVKFFTPNNLSLSKHEKKVRKALLKYESDVHQSKHFLLSIIEPDCAFTEYSTAAMNLLTNIYASDLQGRQNGEGASLMLEVAEFSARMADVLEVQLPSQSNSKMVVSKILEARKAAVKFWFEAGQVSAVSRNSKL